MNSIGDRICETRKSKGLTQEKLAELSQVNLRTIQRIENNENEPRGKTLELYILVVLVNVGFPTGFVTGLLGCLVIALGVLFYGNAIIKLIE